jgi:cytochrome c553
MKKHVAASILAGLFAACGAACAIAQQPAPNFAPSNTSPKGAQAMAANCAMCHGTNGRAAANSTLASLAGKPKDEIAQAMAQFKSGQKPATVMHQIAKGYSDAEIEALAAYFAGQPR